jgi:UDP-3-O-[3-hydroxymyristoyl] glucosamine N-acyltransferase
MRNDDPRNARAITFLERRVSGPDTFIVGVGTYGSRVAHSLSYQSLGAPAEDSLERTVICSRQVADSVSASTKLIVEDPREAFMRFLSRARPDWKRTATAQADDMGVSPGPYDAHRTALVEEGAVVAKGVVLEPYVVIGRGTVVGDETIISTASVIGAHGPAIYKCADGTILSWARMHVGTAQIGKQCEIGAHNVILRGMLGRTRIANNAILGNMVHIGHGVDVGERVWMAASVTVCGHASIAHDVSIGAGATIRDNVDIGAGASIGMGSVVVGSVAPGKSVRGVPARETNEAFHSGPTL